jgi:hypothetical protein
MMDNGQIQAIRNRDEQNVGPKPPSVRFEMEAVLAGARSTLPFCLPSLQIVEGHKSMFGWLNGCKCEKPTMDSTPTFKTSGDDEAVVELKRNDFLVLRNQNGTFVILETLRASYWWNRERATLRWKTINGTVIDGGTLNCFIQYQSRWTGWGQRTLRRRVGSSTITLAAYTLEWSYSTKRSVWIYLPPDVQYALKTDEQGNARELRKTRLPMVSRSAATA